MRGIKLSLLLLVALFSADLPTQAGYVPPGRIASLVRDYIIKQAGEGEGSFQVVGVRSPYSLYNYSLATYDKEDAFDHRAAVGFIKLWGLPLWTQAQVQR